MQHAVILLLAYLLLCFLLLGLFLFILLERLLSLDLLHQTSNEVVFLLDVFSGLTEFIAPVHGLLPVLGEIGEILIFCEDICLVLELGVVCLVAEPENAAVVGVEVGNNIHVRL